MALPTDYLLVIFAVRGQILEISDQLYAMELRMFEEKGWHFMVQPNAESPDLDMKDFAKFVDAYAKGND